MSKLRCAVVLSFLMGVGVAAGPGQDRVVTPEPDGNIGLGAPFSCGVRVQQVWDARLFPAAIRIDAITFFNNFHQSAESYIDPAHYRFFLSVTDATSDTVTADFEANYGRRVEEVAEMTVVGTSTGFSDGAFGTLTLELTKAFQYNPRKGNLLLEIQKDQSSCDGDGPIYVDGSSNADGVTLVTQEFGIFPHFGMTVGFDGKLHGRGSD